MPLGRRWIYEAYLDPAKVVFGRKYVVTDVVFPPLLGAVGVR